MTTFAIETLVIELETLTDANTLRTDEETSRVAARVAEICGMLGEVRPSDVFDRYGD